MTLDDAVGDLTLPVRCLHAFTAYPEDWQTRTWRPPTPAILTVGDLTQWRAADLLRLPGIGRRSVRDIAAALEAAGLLPAHFWGKGEDHA